MDEIMFCEKVKIGKIKYSIFEGHVEVTKVDKDVSGYLEILDEVDGRLVTNIGINAFKGLSNLEEVKFPKNLEFIAYSAFENCGIKKINLPESLRGVGAKCFSGCINLQEIDLPRNMVSIQNETFAGCKALKRVKLPKGIWDIKYNTFADCKSLEEIEIPPNIIQIDGNAFDGCDNLKKVIIWESPIIFTKCIDSVIKRCRTEVREYKTVKLGKIEYGLADDEDMDFFDEDGSF